MTRVYFGLRNGQYACLHVAADSAINMTVIRWTRGRWALVCRSCGEEIREPEPPRDPELEHDKELN